jgi:hypothetical protein
MIVTMASDSQGVAREQSRLRLRAGGHPNQTA